MHRIAALILIVVASSACAGTTVGFDSTGFRSTQNHYRIPYKQGSKSLLGPEWRVENFRHDDQGNPVELIEGGTNEGTLEWRYSDGVVRQASTTIYDLDLSHSTNAAIWVRVIPIPQHLRRKQLDVLSENYVNNLTGSVETGYFSDRPPTRRVATKIIESEAIGLLGSRAHIVRFDMVDLDQLELDENAPRTRAEIVLVKTRFRKAIKDGPVFDVPAYLLLGYSNDEAAFEEHIGTFRRFAQSIELVPSE